MIQSMTGYSRAARRIPGGTITAELRSTNHRYLDIGQRLPEGLVGCEAQVSQLIRGCLRRGRVDLTVTAHLPQQTSRRVVVDEPLVAVYHARLLKLKTQLGLQGPVTLDHLLALPHVLSVTDDQAQRQTLWPEIRQTIEAALRKLLEARRREGRRLVNDIRSRASAIKVRTARIRARLRKSIAEQRRRLRQRLPALFGGKGSATAAQLQEAVAMLKDVDIHEELVRLTSHLTHLEQTPATQESVGKNLDFIAQELMRETNTIGSKANDAPIARAVIEMKGAIEQIREQAQNLE